MLDALINIFNLFCFVHAKSKKNDDGISSYIVQ